MAEIAYAKVGGPPVDWHGLKVIDLDTGAEIKRVVEVDAANGWLIRHSLNDKGLVYADPENPERVAQERIAGRFKILPPDGGLGNG